MSDVAKRNAAAAALERVEPGMVLGLGTGSTAAIFVRLLAERVKGGLDITGTPTSDATDRLARELGIRLADPNVLERIDLTVDGADEFDARLRLIKGGGAALLREKIIADASDHVLIIADGSKEVAVLGRFPLPIEINPFACELTRRLIHDLVDNLGMEGATSAWRMAGPESQLRTDGGHLILDLSCGAIPEPEVLSEALDAIPGVVEHGLFIDLADEVIVGTADGVRSVTPRHLQRM